MSNSNLLVDDILLGFGRQKKKMAYVGGAILLATFVLNLLLPRSYVSEGQMLVRLGRENIGLDPTVTAGESDTLNVSPSRVEEMNTVAMVLRSRTLADKVLHAIGIARILNQDVGIEKGDDAALAGYSPSIGAVPARSILWETRTPHEAAVFKLSENLSVSAVEASNVVRISYSSHDPLLSQEVVAKVLELYTDEHIRLHRTPGAQQFLFEQAERVRRELERVEKKLCNLKMETGVAAPVEQRAALIARLARLQDEALTAESDLATADAKVDKMRHLLKEMAATHVTAEVSGISSPATDGMRQRLYELQLEYKSVLSVYPENHRNVVRVQDQIAAAEEVLSQQQQSLTHTTQSTSRSYEEMQLQIAAHEPELAALMAKTDVLKKQLRVTQDDLNELNQNSRQVEDLKREADIYDLKYRTYAIDTEKARIGQSLELAQMTNISVIQPATLDTYPVSPNSKLNLLVGLVVAVCASGFVAVWFEANNKAAEVREK